MALWNLDPAHTQANFSVRHMMVATVRGSFDKVSGTLEFDPQNPAHSRVEATIEAASINTGLADRDAHLRSADVFDVENYPTITFKSTSVKAIGDNKLAVTGDLTMHGVTKSITVEMDVFPAKETRQGVRCGFETTFTIKRTDFGMDTYVTAGGLGDEVQVIVAVEGVKK